MAALATAAVSRAGNHQSGNRVEVEFPPEGTRQMPGGSYLLSKYFLVDLGNSPEVGTDSLTDHGTGILTSLQVDTGILAVLDDFPGTGIGILLIPGSFPRTDTRILRDPDSSPGIDTRIQKVLDNSQLVGTDFRDMAENQHQRTVSLHSGLLQGTVLSPVKLLHLDKPLGTVIDRGTPERLLRKRPAVRLRKSRGLECLRQRMECQQAPPGKGRILQEEHCHRSPRLLPRSRGRIHQQRPDIPFCLRSPSLRLTFASILYRGFLL